MHGILRTSICVTLLGLLALPAGGGDNDKRSRKAAKPDVAPARQVEQLLHTLKSERKDDRRAKAVESLGKLAAPEYPEIVSALVDALVRDDSTSVRKTVIKTLADIEPPTHEVKDALEQAAKQDKSWTVRQAARLASWRYKPKDAPPTVPAPQTRYTSKPPANGKLPATPKLKPEPAGDPLKTNLPPVPVLPVVPSNDPPAPTMAPGPAKLTAPRP